jgi:quercetin dioxygenase-like cupin family protein
MVFRYKDIASTEIMPGANRKLLARGGALMVVEASFAAGTIVAAHAHRHEQVTYIVRGRIEVTMNGATDVLTDGDSFYAGPNVAHGVRFLEDSLVTDTFTPQREDFLA